MRHENLSHYAGEPAPVAKYVAFALGLLLTVTSVAISMMTAWGHGTNMLGQLTWPVLMSAPVLVVHFASFIRPLFGRYAKLGLPSIWMLGLLLVQYNHASFFLAGQYHLGETRAAAVSITPETPPSGFIPKRSLTDVADDIASTKASQSKLAQRSCSENCGWIRVQRDTLAARLDALNIEAEDVRRWQAMQERHAEQIARDRAQRDVARDDPVLASLSAWVGVTVSQLGLITAVLFSVMLDVTASLCWTAWSRSLAVTAAIPVTPPVSVTDSTSVTPEPTFTKPPAKKSTSHRTLAQLVDLARPAVEAGELPLTVTPLMTYLECGRTRASEVRKILLAANDPLRDAA
jgi:hypothetical protein